MDPQERTVLTVAEACRAFDRNVVRSELRARRWQRAHRGVLVTHNGPLADDERELVRLLACPPGSALAGASALRHDGLRGFDPDLTTVAIPHGGRHPLLDGVQIHESTMLDDRDVHPLRVPRRTRPARSAVDLASWSERPRYARAVILAAVQQRLVRTSDLRDALSRRGRCRHRGLIIESVLDASGGIQSLPERDFDQIRLRCGLPTPTRQSPVRRDDGRYYLDVAWLDDGIACEIHGIPHREIAQWDSDLLRANEIVIAGPKLMIFSSYAIRHEPEVVGDQLVRLFRRAGSRRRF